MAKLWTVSAARAVSGAIACSVSLREASVRRFDLVTALATAALPKLVCRSMASLIERADATALKLATEFLVGGPGRLGDLAGEVLHAGGPNLRGGGEGVEVRLAGCNNGVEAFGHGFGVDGEVRNGRGHLRLLSEEAAHFRHRFLRLEVSASTIAALHNREDGPRQASRQAKNCAVHKNLRRGISC